MEGLLTRLSPEKIEALEKAVEAELLRRALTQKVVGAVEDAIVRDLLPSDLNSISGEDWVEAISAASYNTVFSGQLSTPDRLIAVYGVGDNFKASVSGANDTAVGHAIGLGRTLKFGVGAGPAKIKDIWDLGKIRSDLNITEAFADRPVIYNKGDKFTIQMRGDGGTAAAATMDHVVLFGKICEPRGTTIQGQ
jgi:hypothetical protein